ncbi:tetratricopeptide repeat-containing sensor histidine kinase [Spirosoma pollinicola]|uniref:histidine kinase n=1 Tax=Spirosoma pollinicola TaxID=2057025 RepID=A0A2K8YW39_9BACT|nr:tetratricopeptide repeat protein [Spirosoma pollinicola]AUD01841.1 histidine kinase [Spirosoma pollinicola]
MKRHLGVLGCLLALILIINYPAQAQRRLIDSLKTTLRQKMPDTARAATYYDIANTFYKQSQLDSALYYLKPMLSHCQRTHYLAGLGDYNLLTSVVRLHQGLFEESILCAQAAINYFTRCHKLGSVAKVYHNLGLLYKTMGEDQKVRAHLEKGRSYMFQAISINQALKANRFLAENYVNLGIIYEDLGEFERGKDCFFKALVINDAIHAKPEAYRVIYNDLGKNYTVQGQYDQAIVYLNKALAINLDLNRTTSLVHNYRNLSTAYLALKKPEQAIKYGEKAIALVETSKDAPLTRSVYKMMSQMYASTGKYDKAYYYSVQQKRIEDSLMNLDKTRTIARLEGQYTLKKANELATIQANLALAKAREIARIESIKEKEIAAIQAEKSRRIEQIRAAADIEKTRAIAEVQAKYETQKRINQISILDQQSQQQTRKVQYMAGILGLLGLLLSILVGLYWALRRANRRLSAQNEIITSNSKQLVSQSDQLRTLMKELHHRVKNNLAIVSSLLTLQANGLTDEKAIQALRKGQQRVQAMSLIHQRLYQTDKVTIVNIREYLTDLAESLMQAYGYEPATFDLQVDVALEELDVDVAMPLGLIVNELITNSFKYAFAHQERPFLRIKLDYADGSSHPGITLEVQDNGPGIKTTDWHTSGNRASFGRRLVTSLTEQLEGQFELYSNNGTLCRLHIPQTRVAA